MRGHIPSHLSHMETSMIIIMIPQVEYVLIFVGGIVGGDAHVLDVSLGKEFPILFALHASMGA